MKVCIFVGPTIPESEARAVLEATYLPPVSEGEICRIARERPTAIGIIDGYFECVPAVWHKEILYALSCGIHMYGSGSMGALRAAELAPFGMEGVGAIFEAYRDSHLEDDDEVAVIHGPRELGFLTLSEAMVNIRRTLSDAVSERVIDAECREALETIAKDLPYRERNYGAILELGRQVGLRREEIGQLQAWLPFGRVDQKREDALLMLRTMRDRLRRGCEPKRVGFHFEHTSLWETAQAHSQSAG